MIPRTISEVITRDVAGYPVVTILGPRQSGKTTLARALFPQMAYANLEDPATRDFAVSDPRGFLAQRGDGLIIDEFQRSTDLLSHIQQQVDEIGTPGQFVLTGSQNFLMMEQISQSLAGRVGIFSLLPLSMEELAGARSAGVSVSRSGLPAGELEPQLFTGFFPRLYTTDLNPTRYYANYVQTYLERDVRQLRNVGDLVTFQRFLRLIAGRVGQLVNTSSIGDDLGISHNTVKAWLTVLEASYVLLPLRPYHRNFNKQIIKSSKVYFQDTGLLCYLLGIEKPGQLQQHYLRGGVFENLVIVEFSKWYANRGQRGPLYFWRDRRGHEIDMILETGTNRVAVEIKAGRTLSSDQFAGLDYYGALDTGCPSTHRYLMNGGIENQNRSRGHVRGWRELADIGSAFALATPDL